MDYKKVDIKEEKERKQKERNHLIEMLKEEGKDANNTFYKKRHRADQVIEMINDLIYFLYEDPKKLLIGEQDLLTGLIKQLVLFLVEKSAENKREINTFLRKLEIISKENIDILSGNQPAGLIIRNG